MAKDNHTDETARYGFETVRIREFTRLGRWTVVTVALTVIAWKIIASVTQLLDRPAWLIFLTTLITSIIPAFGSWMLLFRQMKRGAKARHDLIKTEQEKRIPSRTGTGLTPTGDNPPEDNA